MTQSVATFQCTTIHSVQQNNTALTSMFTKWIQVMFSFWWQSVYKCLLLKPCGLPYMKEMKMRKIYETPLNVMQPITTWLWPQWQSIMKLTPLWQRQQKLNITVIRGADFMTRQLCWIASVKPGSMKWTCHYWYNLTEPILQNRFKYGRAWQKDSFRFFFFK